MSSIYLPTLLFWENGNSWYGSLGQARFFLKPETPEEMCIRDSMKYSTIPLCRRLRLTTSEAPIKFWTLCPEVRKGTRSVLLQVLALFVFS